MGRPAGEFEVGQRVRLSGYAKRKGIRLQSRANDLGTVVSASADRPLTLVVLPDGYKQPRSYHVDFREPA